MAAYEDALNEAIEAIRGGQPIETVLARFPEHAEALRRDLALREDIARFAAAIPAPGATAQRDAAARLAAQLRAPSTPGAATAPWHTRLRLPRLALAAAVLAIGVLAGAMVLTGGDSSVHAATLEGVVVENEGDTLIVQTLDALEEVEVPLDAVVADVAGETIALEGIEVGEVVVVNAERLNGRLIARRVARLVDNIEAWCTDRSERCALLAERLDQARLQCQERPASCLPLLDRLTDLRTRALDTATLERLRAACRSGAPEACRELVAFCRLQGLVCGELAPENRDLIEPGAIRERLQALNRACSLGDELACRQLAQVCANHPALCPEITPARPTVTPPVERPVPPPSTRPLETRPTSTPPARDPAPQSLQPSPPAATSTPTPADVPGRPSEDRPPPEPAQRR